MNEESFVEKIKNHKGCFIKPSKQIKQKLRDGDWKRSSGLGLCPKCKEELFDHNRIEGYEGCVIDCNDGIHKL